MKRVMSLLLALMMLLPNLSVAAYASEERVNPTKRENQESLVVVSAPEAAEKSSGARIMQEQENDTNLEGLFGAEGEVPDILVTEVPDMAAATEVSFRSFAELKALAQEGYSDATVAVYSGADVLMIDENLEIPANLSIHVESGVVLVTGGATLVLPSRYYGERHYIQNLVVDGTLTNNSELATLTSLNVNGTLAGYGLTFAFGSLQISGTMDSDGMLAILYDFGGRLKVESGAAFNNACTIAVVTDAEALPADAITGMDLTKYHAQPGHLSSGESIFALTYIEGSDDEVTFSSFAELKALAQKSYSEATVATYTAVETLTIYENLEIPENLFITVRDSAVFVPKGITLKLTGDDSVVSHSIGALIVDGCVTLNSYTFIYGSVQISGTLNNMICMDIFYDDGGSLYIAPGGVFNNNGDLYVTTTAETFPADAITGVNLNQYLAESLYYDGVHYFSLTYKGDSEKCEVTRLSGRGRCETAIAAADELKALKCVDKFEIMLLASGNNFPDALAGSYLAAVCDAPILLYQDGKNDIVVDYVNRNLANGGMLYILGAGDSVSTGVEKQLRSDISVDRVASASRYGTCLKILKKADAIRGAQPDKVLICSGLNFADSLSASATGLPILLIKGDDKALKDSQIEYLSGLDSADIYVIGGEKTINPDLMNTLHVYDRDGRAERISGTSREKTSVEVAKKFFPEARAATLAFSQNFPDGLSGGPIAYTVNAPLLLIASGKEAVAADYVAERGIKTGYIFGGVNAVSDASVKAVFGTGAMIH